MMSFFSETMYHHYRTAYSSGGQDKVFPIKNVKVLTFGIYCTLIKLPRRKHFGKLQSGFKNFLLKLAFVFTDSP